MSKGKESRTKSFIRALRDGDCFKTYIFHHDFSNTECANAVFKSMFGIQKMLVDVPQLYTIIKNKSGEGINPVSAIMDILSTAFHFTYLYRLGSPAVDWIPSAIGATEKAAIPTLLYYYKGEKTKAAGVAAGYIASVVFLATIIPIQVLAMAQYLEIPILLVSTVIQMYTNHVNDGTGYISIMSKAMSLMANAETVFEESLNYYIDGGDQEDFMAIITSCAKLLADVVIVGQFVYLNRKNIQELLGLIEIEKD